MSKLKVYVAGPYSNGDTVANIREAVLAGDRLHRAGLVLFIPHLNYLWHMHCPKEYEVWLAYDFEWVAVCDALSQTARREQRRGSGNNSRQQAWYSSVLR